MKKFLVVVMCIVLSSQTVFAAASYKLTEEDKTVFRALYKKIESLKHEEKKLKQILYKIDKIQETIDVTSKLGKYLSAIEGYIYMVGAVDPIEYNNSITKQGGGDLIISEIDMMSHLISSSHADYYMTIIVKNIGGESLIIGKNEIKFSCVNNGSISGKTLYLYNQEDFTISAGQKVQLHYKVDYIRKDCYAYTNFEELDLGNNHYNVKTYKSREYDPIVFETGYNWTGD